VIHRSKQKFALAGLWDRIGIAKELCEDFESHIAAKVRELDLNAVEIAKFDDDDHRDAAYDGLDERQHRYSSEWTSLLRESLFLALCSSFEHYVTRFADAYAEYESMPFKCRDLNDRGIRACETLMRRAGLSTKAFQSEWRKLKELYLIRNRIAHGGGDHNDETRNLVKRYPTIFSVPTREKVEILPHGISSLCEIMTAALRQINIQGNMTKAPAK